MIGLKVMSVVGCRSHFTRLAPLIEEMRRSPEVDPVLVHTGQYYEDALADPFFRDLPVPTPDIVLDVGTASHAKQTAAIMDRFEDAVFEVSPDVVVVVGGGDSTVAASMTAVKLGVPVAHVDAGLRSFDREIPEEINRVMTDAISDILFVSETAAVDNLTCEGIPAARIHFVGNLVIDALLSSSERILASTIVEDLSLDRRGYAVLSLRRPPDVDRPARFLAIATALRELQRRIPIVCPVDFHTIARFHQLGVWEQFTQMEDLRVIGPLGHLDFVALLKGSRMTLTDTGGVQEETTACGVPCLTLRATTQRPSTVTDGSNTLVGEDPDCILAEAMPILRGEGKVGRVPSMWDGHASKRIVDQLLRQRELLFERYRNLRSSHLRNGVPGRPS